MFKFFARISVPAFLVAITAAAPAAQLTGDARAAIPHDVQQLVVIDYRAMQNSSTAMELRDRVMPPDLKQFDDAIRKSGLNDNHDIDQLAFALFRMSASSEDLETVGIAQGQFDVADIMANFRKQKVVAKLVRTNRVFPLAHTGMVLCFVDPSTMVFGSQEAVKKALDVRDGLSAGMLTNAPMMDAMRSVDSDPLWSILDKAGTQTMMKQVLGEAGSVTDFESVRKRLDSSWYGMNFQHGVKFDLTIATGDSFAAATVSSLLSAAIVYKKMSGDETEKAALAATDITSNSGQLNVHFATTDNDFNALLKSSLFQSMIH
ncbi:hypothetical protein P8935_17030 [Telmatobacter sp. DSM 110680]|uniref:DUF2059 domain-containing protein n=1 Tax=Telmatobacter sp. DSM 110680 TaxID=3036704 RepID=A0AAU7DG00_9BACT